MEPPIITKHPEDQDANESEGDVTFSVTAEGEELNFKWKKSGNSLAESMGHQGEINFKSAKLDIINSYYIHPTIIFIIIIIMPMQY